MDLLETEIRVLGSLLEKQRTTPDAYPLSLNSLRLACNQATNRDPVVDYDDAILRDALHRLQRRGYARLTSSATSRTSKYRHLLADALPMDAAEQAVMCVLMLRGAQTPGELKQRSDRLHAFAELADVQATLEQLMQRELVARLERRPGQKEERYAQLLGDSAQVVTVPAPATPALPAQPLPPPAAGHPGFAAPSAHTTLGDLQQRVTRLEGELAELREQLTRAPARKFEYEQDPEPEPPW
ncbi:MAG TPA: YceH family protein [Solirubrobacteraceae bacterium]|nr:YceH family protein [Solirubrobacteraceae bacterium]